ncbi:hypothetical protein Plim_2118 [Planctopirus limnophila DSM 3776]|uniref:Uncharacterized protein n=1 Tax=Planctopirus limnophila (strain ATCC 43296 / DSM 3776 / IFAM 1008 / Mu 290) TaxID=521674 RepID=D5SMP0_PLAL2|nr:hypothetical protein [Planctopirus limnophila]ADG67945.1 hypothetical protein Plim_2118 [Planctopirus limnophila DSM 3776]
MTRYHALLEELQSALELELAADQQLEIRVGHFDQDEATRLRGTKLLLISCDSVQTVAMSEDQRCDEGVLQLQIVRNVNGANRDSLTIEALDQFVESLKDSLPGSLFDSGRLLTLLPSPLVSPDLLRSPGIYLATILVSFQQFYTIEGVELPEITLPDPLPIVSRVRQAVWEAIDHWEWPEGFEWGRIFETDADVAELALRGGPAVDELPALSARWQVYQVQETMNRLEDLPLRLVLEAWLPVGWQTLAEVLADQLMRAVISSAPTNGAMPFVRAVIGHVPRPLGPVSITEKELPGPSGRLCLQVQVVLGLLSRTDLYHQGA